MRLVNSNISLFIFTVLINLLVIYFKFSQQEPRLPTNLEPRHYDLRISTNLDIENPVFLGDVKIRIKCNRNTKHIILNKKELDINEAQVKVNMVNSEEIIEIVDHKYPPETDLYKIILNADLENGKEYVLFIPFQGHFSTDSTGFILINHPYERGSEIINRFHAVTHLGRYDARRVFPCFDQIHLKAPFKISITHPKNFRCFSNMNRSEFEELPQIGKWIMDEFAESVPIPPYLVTIALVPKGYTSKKLPVIDSKTPIEIYAHKSDIEEIQYGGELLLQSFIFYQDYFNISYALLELNVIVFPDFENFDVGYYGSIAVGKSFMIAPSSKTGIAQFDRAMDMCHLTSYQWIRSYATMSSWNEDWLHSALALHLSVLCVKSMSKWVPEFSEIHIADEFFFVFKQDQAGLIDKSPDSKNDLSQQSQKTDYHLKGQQLIRMLHFVLGDEVFQSCITTYLKQYKFKNSTVSQLWSSFSKTVSAASAAREKPILPKNMTVDKIMESWTKQTGLPLVAVTVNHKNNAVLIEQGRFMLLDELNGKKPGSNRGSECWHIPLTYYKRGALESEGVIVKNWLTCDEPISLKVDPEFKKNEWFLVNLNFNVLSRTNYNIENWVLLQKTLLNKNEYLEINAMTRAKLISDMSEFSRAGLLEYELFFETIQYLVHEKSLLPWKIASEELETIRIQLYGSMLLDSYKEYIRKILNPVFSSLENANIVVFSKTDYLQNKFKKIIFELSCDFGIEACQQRCNTLFKDFTRNVHEGKQNLIPKWIRYTAYCHAIKSDTQGYWEFLWSRYNKNNPSAENDTVLEALGCSPHTKTLENYLLWSLDKEKVAPSDSFKIFRSLARNEVGYKIMKNFLGNKIKKIYDLNQEANLPIDPYFSILLDNSMNNDDKHKIMVLVLNHKHEFYDFEKIWNHNTDVASRNVLWLEKNEKKFEKFFWKYRIPSLQSMLKPLRVD